MWYNLLANETRNATIPEAILYAALGFLIVFVGIAFLILVVWAIGKIMNKTSTPKVAKPEIVAPVVETKEEELSDEIVAVITAAITAYYQQNNPKCEFTVKRIKRI